MKTFLVFDDEKPEDMALCKKMLQVDEWIGVVERVAESIRRDLKYGHQYDDADQALAAMRNLIAEELSDRQLSLY